MNVPMEELEQFVKNQLDEREPFYLQADHIIEGPVDDLQAFAEMIRGSISALRQAQGTDKP